MFKTVESFQKQITKAIDKMNLRQAAVTKALNAKTEARKEALEVADSVRGEADALIVRANQINKMVDTLVGNAHL